MGIFDFAANRSHKIELRDSIDEIFIGELIHYMYKNNAVLVELQSIDENNHELSFKFKDNPVLYLLNINISRKVGGVASKIVGSQSTISFEAVIRNEVVEPEDIVKMYKSDFKNIAKTSLFGNIVIDHDLNYIYAKTQHIKNLNKYVNNGKVNKEEIYNDIDEVINKLIEHLAPLKKSLGE